MNRPGPQLESTSTWCGVRARMRKHRFFHVSELSHVCNPPGDRPGRTVRTTEDDRRRGGRRQERLPRRNDQPAGRQRRAGARRLCHHGACLPAVPAARRAGPAHRRAPVDAEHRRRARAGRGRCADPRLGRSTRRFRPTSKRPSAPVRLLDGDNPGASYAVRSSATAEDLPDASFAGQQETFLNVSGIDDVLHRMKEVFASLYNDRAISYRVHKGFAHADVALSAGVQRMVRSDLGAAGVMFTIDTESGFKDVVFITSELRPGRDGGAGRGQPRRVLRAQADAGGRRFPVIRRSLGSKLQRMEFARPRRRPPAASWCAPSTRRPSSATAIRCRTPT
jgi:hypothetical protein